MKFAVLGAGAIGAYLGAALARGGADVTLVARGEHLRAMQADGVRVLSPRGDFEAHPFATDDVDAIGDADVVFIGLKANSLPALAQRIGARIPLTVGPLVIAVGLLLLTRRRTRGGSASVRSNRFPRCAPRRGGVAFTPDARRSPEDGRRGDDGRDRAGHRSLHSPISPDSHVAIRQPVR